jgi:hypothetical protein
MSLKLIIEPTDQIVQVGARQARVWEGHTDDGAPVQLLVMQVALHNDQPPEAHARFAHELQDSPPLRAKSPAFDLRYFLD